MVILCNKKTEKTINQEQSLAEPGLVEIKPQKVITNSIGMRFVLIPTGKFVMGSPPNEPGRNVDEKQHEVRFSKPFYLQTTEVSQNQWNRVMQNNPSRFQHCGDSCPIENVSWNDAQKFIEKLNQMEITKKYRLPTEAEWEYACRAGTETPYSFDEVDKIGQYGWYQDDSINQIQLVGGKNSSLGEMIQNLAELHVRVPSGFAVTTDAYNMLLEREGLGAYVFEELDKYRQGDQDLSKAGLNIRQRFRASALPDELTLALIDA